MPYVLAPALAALRKEIDAVWPHRDRSSDGWIGDTSHAARPSDHNPDWSAGGIVRAIDIDEDLVAGLAATGEAMPLVERIIRDRRVAYVIYEGRIWQNPAVFKRGGWSTYTGVNAHRHHIHVSVRRSLAYDSDRSPWAIASVPPVTSGGAAPAVIRPDPLIPLPEEDTMLVVYAETAGTYLLDGGRLLGLDLAAATELVTQGAKTVSISRDRYLEWLSRTGPGVLVRDDNGSVAVSIGGASFVAIDDPARYDHLRSQGLPVLAIDPVTWGRLVTKAN